ncbi:MAG: GntR family transcriptional regulator [Nocardioidaceae bacterium]
MSDLVGERAEDVIATAATSLTSQRVADYLRDSILRGEFRPGDRIRQEDVAARFGASRVPVREALRMLEAEGLTEHHANIGARVPELDRFEVDILYQMRERLEPLILAESIPHLRGDDLVQLRHIQERIEADDDLSHFLELDRELHLLSYSGCRFDQLLATVTRLWNSTQHYRRVFMALSGPGRRWVVTAEHRLLLDAIERGDIADAERHILGHVRRTRIELAKHPDVFARPDATGRVVRT